MFKIFKLSIYSLIFIFFACGKDEKVEANTVLAAEFSEVKFASWARSREIEIKTNGTFNANSSESWCKVKIDGKKLQISVEENTSSQERYANITLTAPSAKDVQIQVIQSGKSAVFELNHSRILEFAKKGDTKILTLLTSLPVKINSSANWVNASFDSDKATDNLSIAVQANDTNADREAVLTFSADGMPNIELTIKQLVGGDPKYTLILCGQGRVVMMDEASSNGQNINITWEWNVAELANHTNVPSSQIRRMGTLDECKPVDNNTKLLLTSSNSGGILLLDIASKKPLFYAGGQNAHSADLLPNNKIVAALSTGDEGNKVVVYDINKPDEIIYQETLLGGHGLVWIPERNRVYALGSREIIEYSLVNWDSNAPQLKRERIWNVPGNSGHDLSRVNKDKLLITSDYTYTLDLNEGTFTTFSALQGVTNVKSVNYFENTGWLIYTRGENGEYWTNNVYMKNPTKTITIPDYRIYKARLMENK